MAQNQQFEEYNYQFGYNCLNCEAYGKWNNNVLEIPCMNCARQGDPTKHDNSFHNDWNWKWNGVECWGTLTQSGVEASVNEIFNNALARMERDDLSMNEVISTFIPTSLVNRFTHDFSIRNDA